MNNQQKPIPPEDPYFHLAGSSMDLFCSEASCWCHHDNRRIGILSKALDKKLISDDHVGLYFDGELPLPEEVFYR